MHGGVQGEVGVEDFNVLAVTILGSGPWLFKGRERGSSSESIAY